MNRRWKLRGLALTIALALLMALAAGIAEAPLEANSDEPPVGAEQVEQSIDADELDLGGAGYADDASPEPTVTAALSDPGEAPVEGDAVNPEETPGPEDSPAAGETPDPEAAPEAPSGAAQAPETEAVPGDASEPEAAPKAAASAKGEAKPEENPSADGEAKSQENPSADSEAKPEENPSADGEAKPDENPSADTEAKPDENASADGEAEAAQKSEAASEPEATPASEDTAAPEATATPAAEASPAPENEMSLEAAEIVEADVETAAKVDLEAAAVFAFPAEKLTLGKGEWIEWPVQTPAGVDPAAVSYASSKPAVVKVAAGGVLHAVKKGSATITAAYPDGRTAACKVTVKKAPSRIKLSPKKLIFGIGEVRTLKVKLSKGSASGAITWTSSNPAVCVADAAGNLVGVGVGTAKITARTFNGKRASRTVTVLSGLTPTTLTFAANPLYLGLKEKQWLSPILGQGEAALYTFSSNKKSVVSVSKSGLLTAKKKGTATITVKTHNGLKYKLTVKVIKAPTKVTLSKTKLSLETGQVETLGVTLPSGTASAVTWTSSKPEVASVDSAGNVFGLAPGTAKITAKAFNGKSATCTVTVTLPPSAQEIADRTPPALSNAQMAANLRTGSFGGSKRDNLANIVELMMNAGYEPTFAAGVAANIYSEGSYGKLESSHYVANYQKRPAYFCFLDGGLHYKLVNGTYVPDVEYVDRALFDAGYKSTVAPTTKPMFGPEHYYWERWSGKYVWNVDLNELQYFIDLLTNGCFIDGTPDSSGEKWQGKFGMGCTQWTGGRTRKLMAKYRRYAGGGATITKAQVIAAEHEQILEDLGGDYKKKVYDAWKTDNANALYGEKAAYNAGSIVCLKYEIPAGASTSAVKRGNNAITIYKIMVGLA